MKNNDKRLLKQLQHLTAMNTILPALEFPNTIQSMQDIGFQTLQDNIKDGGKNYHAGKYHIVSLLGSAQEIIEICW